MLNEFTQCLVFFCVEPVRIHFTIHIPNLILEKRKNKYVIIDSNKPISINKKIITKEIDKFIK